MAAGVVAAGVAVSLEDGPAEARAPPVPGAGPDGLVDAPEPPESPPAGPGPPEPPDVEPPPEPSPPDGPRFGLGGCSEDAADPVPSASLSSCGMSIPVRPFTVADASVTVLVAFLTTSDAPSVERTVRLSMAAIGSAAARTISGSIDRTVWMIAASLNWRYASARSAKAQES